MIRIVLVYDIGLKRILHGWGQTELRHGLSNSPGNCGRLGALAALEFLPIPSLLFLYFLTFLLIIIYKSEIHFLVWSLKKFPIPPKTSLKWDLQEHRLLKSSRCLWVVYILFFFVERSCLWLYKIMIITVVLKGVSIFVTRKTKTNYIAIFNCIRIQLADLVNKQNIVKEGWRHEGLKCY